MARIKLLLAYEGTDFSGWQLQPHDRTVQGEVEKGVATILGESVRVHGSGRTDSGVHAMGQVAHFDCGDGRADLPWQRALNAILPKDVRVLDAVEVSKDFHARYSAKSKIYEYTLWHNRAFCLPQRRRFVWGCGTVDFARMEAAAGMLLGEHDFAAFQNVGTPVQSTVRHLDEIAWRKGMTDDETIWRFSASGFLKQMVRNLMGCLVACGQNRITVDQVKSILVSRDRSRAPATAPPQGLSLTEVRYGSGTKV